MRDTNQTLNNFTSSLEKYLGRKIQTIKILRTAVVDNPTLLEEYNLILPRKLFQIRGLCIVLHFIENPTFRFRLLLDLEEHINRFSLKEQRELKLLLYSKNICLKYLFLTQKYSSSEIFGNLLREGLLSLNLIKFSRRKKKVIKPQRKRGYHDKGSLRSSDRWLPSFDISFTEEQNRKEHEKYIHNRTIDRVVSYLLRT